MLLELALCHGYLFCLIPGEVWETVEPPAGGTLKLLSVGCYGVWVLDSNGQLSVRREVTSVFPEGTHWQTIPSLDLNHTGNIPHPQQVKISFCLKKIQH